MRIIHVLHSHGYGGAESHALLLMQLLRAQGHEVMYAGPSDGWLFQQCLQAGIAAKHLAMHGLHDPWSHWVLRRLVKRWQPDIVHGHLVRGAHYAGRSVQGRGQRAIAICTAHATSSYKHMDACRHIIAVCQAVKDNLVRHGHPAGKVTVVYNGMPDAPAPTDRQALRQELGLADDEFAIVNVGRFVPDKGQDMLVKAAASLPPNSRIHFVGDTSTEYGQSVVAQAGQHPGVRFIGYRSDVQRILPAFDAYAVSSRREAFSLSIVEACAARLPCVATRVGGIPEVIRHRETGLLIPVDDAQAMSQALLELQSDPALGRQFGQAARALYESCFTEQKMLQGTLQTYQAALA